jgi:enoyl-CoA hydratase/carnithine racemase
MTDTIQFSTTGQVADLLLCNQSKHNALGYQELELIDQVLATIDADVRVLRIRAPAGGTFCSGANLDQILSGELDGERFQSTTNRIASLPIPTIACISGPVFGGGFEMAMSCDFRIALTGQRLRVPASALGLCYPPEGLARMTRRLGSSLTRRLLVAAEPMLTDELYRLGVLDFLCAESDFEKTIADYCLQLSQLAPLAVSAMLDLIREVEAGDFDVDKARERAQQCLESTDLQEGLLAQRSRRLPAFKGY